MSSGEAELSTPTTWRGDRFASRSDIAAPDLSATPQVTLTHFEAMSSSDGATTFVAGCFRGSAPGWNADVDELVERKLADVTISFATKIHEPAAMTVSPRAVDQGVTTQILDGAGIHGKTWLAFRDRTPIACVLACTAKSDAECSAIAADAHLVGPGDADAPSEGLVLGVLGAMVHHPAASVGGGAGLLALVCLLLVVRRPKRRRRTHF
ncbi:hypothetical protein BH09MYX1_BH09MYX1_62030 [soil metagenome]